MQPTGPSPPPQRGDLPPTLPMAAPIKPCLAGEKGEGEGGDFWVTKEPPTEGTPTGGPQALTPECISKPQGKFSPGPVPQGGGQWSRMPWLSRAADSSLPLVTSQGLWRNNEHMHLLPSVLTPLPPQLSQSKMLSSWSP